VSDCRAAGAGSSRDGDSAGRGPATALAVREDPHAGLAVLTFTPAPGAAPAAYTEYRVDKGRWRRGGSVEVRRRRIFTRVAYRSVDVAGEAGPAQIWEKNWPGLHVEACPAGSRNWTATYDWFRLRAGERWWLDHPVCLIFRADAAPRGGRRRTGASSASAFGVAAVEDALRALGFRSRIYDVVRGLDLASDGGLALGAGDPPDPFVPIAVTQGVKRRLDAGNLQSSEHVRVYGPPQGSFHDPELGSWVLGTCHLDVNELMAERDGELHWGAGLPKGAPDPGVAAELVKYGGNSEWVEQRVAELWEREFGTVFVERGAVPLGEPQDWFQVARRGSDRGRSWVIGKWWRSDGRATVLTLPSR
jgi:hypothetical protein